VGYISLLIYFTYLLTYLLIYRRVAVLPAKLYDLWAASFLLRADTQGTRFLNNTSLQTYVADKMPENFGDGSRQ